MLEQMRQGTQNVFIYVAFGILIVVFTFYFGPGTDGCQPSTRKAAADVNGETLYNTDVTILINRTNRNRRNMTEAEYAVFQGQAMEKLALLYFLSDKATEQGFRVAPEELREYLLDPARNLDFQIYSEDGKFKMEIYERYINNYLEITIEDYETFKSRELLANKYLTTLEGTISVLPGEVDTVNKLRNTKVDLEFVKFDAKSLEEVLNFSDAEVAAYADANGEKIKKYYDDNKKDYGTPKRVRVRRLMVKKPAAAAPEAEKKAAEDKFAQIKDRVVTKGEDFATVVKEVSEDIAYRDKGGDMGWSRLDDMNQDMATVVDGMKAGEVKEHASNFAHFLLKLEEVEEAQEKAIDDVRLEIARKLLVEDEGSKRVEKLANEFLDRAKADPTKNLEEVLLALKPVEKAEAPAEEAPADPTAEGDAPAAEGDTPADPAAEGEKKEEAPKVKTAWDIVMATSTGQFARNPRQSFKFDPELKQIVPTQLPWADLPRIGEDKALALAAFELTADKPLIDKVTKVKDAWYVVRLKERVDPKPEDLEKNREAIEAELRQQRVNAFLGPWQTLFYRPDADLAETSPWLSQLFEDAKKSGKVDIKAGIFAAPVAPVTTEDGAAGGAAPPAAGGTAPPATP